MGFKRAHVEKWVARHVPGERFVSYTGTTTTTAGSVAPTTGVSTSVGDRGDDHRRALADSLDLDPDAEIGRGHSSTFYVVTDRQLVLGTRSSVRNRPADLLHAAPIDGVRVRWFDFDAGAGNHLRHFVTEFGDGAWRADKTGLVALGRALTSSNADHYVAALGEQAIEAPGP